jgi:ABC-type molybdate transport system substrate-binding protein
VVSSSEHKEKAKKFLDFVTGNAGQDIPKNYSFVIHS